MSPVRVALLGCGSYQAAHARRLHANSEAQVVALCDVDELQAQTLIENALADADRPAYYDDPAKMYEKSEPDAVFIATPHTLHYQHCVQGIKAGCHIYVEKPMVTNSADAHRLAEKVQQAGRILVVGYNTPCTPEFEYLRQRIRDKTFGRLEMVIGHLSQNWADFSKGTWRQDPELSGGGQAYDSGAHILNSLVWSVEAKVVQVFAFVDNKDIPVDVNSSINIRFDNGVLASIIVSGDCAVSGSHMAFIFEQGKIEIDPWSGKWINVYDKDGPVKYPPITGHLQFPDDNFIDSILGRAEPRTTAAHGILQSELMDAIYESARIGGVAGPQPTK